jgi:hypothetical protein
MLPASKELEIVIAMTSVRIPSRKAGLIDEIG